MSGRNCRVRANGFSRLLLGEFVGARALLEQCHGLGDPAHRAIGAFEDPYPVMLGQLAVTLAYLGYVDQARSRMNVALSEARGNAQSLAEMLVYASWIEWITRSPEIQRYAEELLTLSTEHGFALFLGMASVFRGFSLAVLGQAREALTPLTQGLAAVRATGTVVNTPLILMGFAEAYAHLGRPAEGLNCLTEAAQTIETTEERVGEVELHRLRGDLLNAIGDRAAAEQAFHQALALAKRRSAKLLELPAATSLARLWRDQGKRTEARDLLAPIYGWFTEGLDTPVLTDAKALLEQLRS